MADIYVLIEDDDCEQTYFLVTSVGDVDEAFDFVNEMEKVVDRAMGYSFHQLDD